MLAYLKLCVHSTIAQYLRDQRPWLDIPFDAIESPANAPDLRSDVQVAEIWEYLCSLLPDERDRLLARCAFILDLKPRQIIELNPGRWAGEREVSVALHRIRQLLRADTTLRRWIGLEGEVLSVAQSLYIAVVNSECRLCSLFFVLCSWFSRDIFAKSH